MSEASYSASGFASYYYDLISRLHSTGKYELAELAQFSHMNDPRDHIIKWRFYANEVPPGDPRYNEFNSNELNKFCKWRFEKVLLDFRPDIVCTPPGSLVLTNYGYKNIEDIKIGEKVYTHKGRFRKVTKIYKKEYNGDILKIKYNGCNKQINLTPEHPVYVLKYKKYTWQNQGRSDLYKEIKPEFIEAKNLSSKDLVVFPCIESHNNILSLKMEKYITNYVKITNKLRPPIIGKLVNNNILLDKKFGELLGYYIGDGTNSGKGLAFFFNGKEIRFAKKVKCLIKDIFDVDCQISKSKYKDMYLVRANSVILAEFFRRFTGKQKNKINFDLLNNKETITGILKGLVRSDGHYSKNTVGFGNADLKKLFWFRALCSFIGIPTGLSFQNKKMAGMCCGYGSSAQKLHGICQKFDIEPENLPQKEPRRRIINIDNKIVTKISRIRKTPYNGIVYNLEVEEDNSYCIENIIVHNCSLLDPVMFYYQMLSPLRPYFHWAISPTVDSAPQVTKWLDCFRAADGVLTYTEYGFDTLKKELGNKCKLYRNNSPGANLNIFKPLNKQQVRQKLGLNPHANIVGTVMRNQPRKLFINLFNAFKKYLDKCRKNNYSLYKDTYLYCHTTFPDLNPWNLEKVLIELELTNKVLFTYKCQACGAVFAEFWQDYTTSCKACKQFAASSPKVNNGITKPQLNEIYNIMDCYIQYCNSEGAGFPNFEAAAAGVPVMGTNYSGTSSLIKNLGGVPINIKYLQRDIGVDAYRAIPDDDHFAEELYRFFSRPRELNMKKGMQTRQRCHEYYNSDKNAKIWEEYFDQIQLVGLQGKWGSPPILPDLQYRPRQDQSDTDFVYDLISNMVKSDHLLHNYYFDDLIRSTIFNFQKIDRSGRNFTKQDIYQIMKNIAEEKFNSEMIRTGQSQLQPEDFLQYAEIKCLSNL